ncbi:MAG TPA: cupin domain-containing protein, partial [Solirubrobacteraceae bacterium]
MSSSTLAKTYKIAADTGLSDIWWKTGRMTIKTSGVGAETGGSLAQLETNDPRGTATPLHIHHNEDETFYVLDGEVSLLVDGKRIDLSAGDY